MLATSPNDQLGMEWAPLFDSPRQFNVLPIVTMGLIVTASN
jgi:hypothetical protein